MIPNISHHQIRTTLHAYQNTSQDAPGRADSSNTELRAPIADTISLRSESNQAVTYSDSMQMSAGDEARLGMLQNLVANLLREQGASTTLVAGDQTIDIATLTPAEAQDLISEDGFFGVEQTSGRIVQFAMAIAGGDPSRIDAIKEGIDKGFAEAKQAFGDWLPDISYDTYDAVMKKLDDWVAESKAVA